MIDWDQRIYQQFVPRHFVPHNSVRCFFRSTTPSTLTGIIARAHQRVRVRASKSVGVAVSMIERSTLLNIRENPISVLYF